MGRTSLPVSRSLSAAGFSCSPSAATSQHHRAKIRNAQPGNAHGNVAVRVESWQTDYHRLCPTASWPACPSPDRERTLVQDLV